MAIYTIFFTLSIKLNKLTTDSFSIISSLSKIASFLDINIFSIYDSRVIYTLNWIILKTNSYPCIKYFPQPAGRNKIIANYDICSLINLYYLTNYDLYDYDSLYYKQYEAYHVYCKMLVSLNNYLWESDEQRKYPFYTEMILFGLSTSIVLEEIKKEVKIAFNN